MSNSQPSVRASTIEFEGNLHHHTVKSLTDSERRHRDLFELCPHCLAVHSHESVVYINTAGAELLGADSPDEIVGRSIWDFVPRASRDRVRDEIRKIHADQQIKSSMDEQIVRLDGTRVDIQCFSGPVLFDGQPAVHVAIYDTSGRRQRERQMREQQEVLSQALRLATLGELAADLSYEVSQPLHTITNLVAACKHKADSGRCDLEDVLHLAKHVQSSLDQAQAILARLSGFVRTSEPKRQRLQLNELIEQAVQLVDQDARRRGVSMALSLAPDLPAVWVERVLMQQVMHNLLQNAFHAISDVPPHERRLNITTKRIDKRSVEMMLADSGIGIPEDKLNHVFARFYSTKPNGTGVGLSISRTVIEAHGGRIWMSKNVDRGVTCHVSLPTSGRAE